MCVTDRHDMTVSVKVAFNPKTTNQFSFSDPNGLSIASDLGFEIPIQTIKMVCMQIITYCTKLYIPFNY